MPTGQNYVSTAPQTNLSGGINNSQTNAITVASFTGYPATPFSLTFDIGTPGYEVIDVLAVSGNTITNCTRGVDGTSASAHGNNATVTHTAIGRDFREARAHIDASTSNDTTGHAVHGLTSGSSVVGTTDAQTLTNKTLTSPTITGLTAANPNITGTVTGGAQYQNITVGSTAVGSVPLTVNGIASETADLIDVEANGTKVFWIVPGGTMHVLPVSTANSGLIVDMPTATTQMVAGFNINGVNQVTIDKNGQLNVLKAPLSVSGITGVANASRYVGSTAGAQPSSGTFSTGDWAIDQTFGGVWINTNGGTPGNWEGAGEMILASTTPGSDVATITISSIPSGFTDLILYVVARSSGSQANGVTDLRMQFNSDTGANYGHRFIYLLNSATVSGSTAASQTSATAGFITDQSAGGSTVGGYSKIVIPYYTNPNWIKGYVFQAESGPILTAWQTGVGGGAWNSTSSINTITLSLADGSNFKAGSIVQLFGRP